MRIESRKAGNLFADPARSVDDYDDVWLAEIGIQYADGQERLPEADERRIRKSIYDIVLKEIPAAGQLPAREAGPCTLKLGVYLVALSFPRAGLSGPRSRGSAVVVSELRDSQTDEPLVRYGQRRDLTTHGRRSGGAPDLDRLEETLAEVLHDVGAALDESLTVNATGARAGLGCKGVIGENRREARNAP